MTRHPSLGPLSAGLRVGRKAISAARLKVHTRSPLGIDAALEIAFGDARWLSPLQLRPLQLRSEMRQFLELVASDPPRSVLEIGTAGGGTTFLLSRVAARDATIVTVDLPGGYSKPRQALLRSFGSRSQRVEPVIADSHDRATVRRIAKLVPRLDLLFIDGDHSAAGVAADFEAYAPLVRPGGLVAFHDIVPGPPELVGGVPEFWRALRNGTWDGRWEFVERWNQEGFGIGVVRLPPHG